MSVAGNQRKFSPGSAQYILLDYFQGIFVNGRHNGHVAEAGVGENQQVVGSGFVIRAFSILNKAAPRIQHSIRKIFVEETFRVAHYVRHLVMLGFVIESFDALYALPLLTEVITDRRVIFPVAAKE